MSPGVSEEHPGHDSGICGNALSATHPLERDLGWWLDHPTKLAIVVWWVVETTKSRSTYCGDREHQIGNWTDEGVRNSMDEEEFCAIGPFHHILEAPGQAARLNLGCVLFIPTK